MVAVGGRKVVLLSHELRDPTSPFVIADETRMDGGVTDEGISPVDGFRSCRVLF